MPTYGTVREPTFDLNDFDQPKMLKPPESWMNDIMYLVFYERGTFHDTPDIGVHITAEAFDNAEYIVHYLKNEITRQVKEHLSDIPVNDINVSSFLWEEKKIHVVAISVTFNLGNQFVTATAYVTMVDETLTYIIRVLGAI